MSTVLEAFNLANEIIKLHLPGKHDQQAHANDVSRGNVGAAVAGVAGVGVAAAIFRAGGPKGYPQPIKIARLFKTTRKPLETVKQGYGIRGEVLGAKSLPSGLQMTVIRRNVLGSRSMLPPRVVVSHPKFKQPLNVDLWPSEYEDGWIHPGLGRRRVSDAQALTRKDMTEIGRLVKEIFPETKGFMARRMRGKNLEGQSGILKFPFKD